MRAAELSSTNLRHGSFSAWRNTGNRLGTREYVSGDVIIFYPWWLIAIMF